MRSLEFVVAVVVVVVVWFCLFGVFCLFVCCWFCCCFLFVCLDVIIMFFSWDETQDFCCTSEVVHQGLFADLLLFPALTFISTCGK